jgi:hypothetical protein
MIKDHFPELSVERASVLFWAMVCDENHPHVVLYEQWKMWKALRGEYAFVTHPENPIK